MDARLKQVKVGDVLTTKHGNGVVVREVCDDYVVGVHLIEGMRGRFEFPPDYFDWPEAPKAVPGATYQDRDGYDYYGLLNGKVGRYGVEVNFDPAIHARVS